MQHEIKKIVIFRLSSIGDIVLTSALVRCVRNQYPHAQIDYVVKKQFAGLVQSNPNVHTIYTLDSKEGFRGLKQLSQKLKKQQYDVFIDIHKNIRSLYTRTRSNATTVLTFKKHVIKRSLLTMFNIDTYKQIKPVYERFIESAKPIHVENDGKRTELFIPEAAEKKVVQLLTDQGISLGTYILLCPGASFANKQWPAEQFANIALKLIDDGYNVVLSGGEKEKSIAQSISSITQNKAKDFTAQLSIIESAVLAKYAKATVVNDTGMLHISEALGTPVVGIYGPTAKQLGYFPILPQSRVAEVTLRCRPCTKMGADTCPKKHWRCMKDITVEHVLQELSHLL